jgi:hypothetical protein
VSYRKKLGAEIRKLMVLWLFTINVTGGDGIRQLDI